MCMLAEAVYVHMFMRLHKLCFRIPPGNTNKVIYFLLHWFFANGIHEHKHFIDLNEYMPHALEFLLILLVDNRGVNESPM